MRLATLANGTRDRRLVLISRDHTKAAAAIGIAATLQEALDSWKQVEPKLRALGAAMETGIAANVIDVASGTLMAPLPRTWQWLDGSAFESHGNLMAKGLRPGSRAS